jgi:hypothetical protein
VVVNQDDPYWRLAHGHIVANSTVRLKGPAEEGTLVGGILHDRCLPWKALWIHLPHEALDFRGGIDDAAKAHGVRGGKAVSTVFIRYYVDLAHSVLDLESALLKAPASWLPGLAEGADEHGQRLLTEVGFPVDGHRIVKRVSIAIGEPVRASARTWIPISWQATGPGGLFPVLDGELEIATLGAHRTQLAFSARYHPPLGLIGRTADRALLSRVAEATIKDFVDRIAERLQDLLGLVRVA